MPWHFCPGLRTISHSSIQQRYWAPTLFQKHLWLSPVHLTWRSSIFHSILSHSEVAFWLTLQWKAGRLDYHDLFQSKGIAQDYPTAPSFSRMQGRGAGECSWGFCVLRQGFLALLFLTTQVLPTVHSETGDKSESRKHWFHHCHVVEIIKLHNQSAESQIL